MTKQKRSSQEDVDNDELVERLMDAYARGLDALKALVLWIEAGTVGSFGISPASMSDALRGLDWFMRELRDGVATGKMSGGPPFDDEEIARLERMRALMEAWFAGGQLHPDVHSLAERIVEMSDGAHWRDVPVEWSKWEST